MQPNLAAQASQAAAQGQQQLSNYNAQAGQSKNDYGTYQAQTDAANNAVKQQAQYMQGEGSGMNQYNTALQSQLTAQGYDPAQMTAARNNLNQQQGALSAYSDFANTGAAKFGLNAGGFAAANAGTLGSLNNNIASQQGVVNGLGDIYGRAQAGANQAAGHQVQSEQNALGGLQDVYANAANQRDQAASMMNFYNDLAQKQGGMNAQQQQNYAQAQQAYAAASQATAQAALLAQQTNLANQQFTHQADLYTNAAKSNPNISIQSTPSAGISLQGSTTSPQRTSSPITMNGSLQGGGVRLQ